MLIKSYFKRDNGLVEKLVYRKRKKSVIREEIRSGIFMMTITGLFSIY